MSRRKPCSFYAKKIVHVLFFDNLKSLPKPSVFSTQTTTKKSSRDLPGRFTWDLYLYYNDDCPSCRHSQKHREKPNDSKIPGSALRTQNYDLQFLCEENRKIGKQGTYHSFTISNRSQNLEAPSTHKWKTTHLRETFVVASDETYIHMFAQINH